jgi:hypothetical protein
MPSAARDEAADTRNDGSAMELSNIEGAPQLKKLPETASFQQQSDAWLFVQVTCPASGVTHGLNVKVPQESAGGGPGVPCTTVPAGVTSWLKSRPPGCHKHSCAAGHAESAQTDSSTRCTTQKHPHDRHDSCADSIVAMTGRDTGRVALDRPPQAPCPAVLQLRCTCAPAQSSPLQALPGLAAAV